MTITRNEPVSLWFRDVTSIEAGGKKGQLIISTYDAPQRVQMRLTDSLLKPEIITRRLVLHVELNSVEKMKRG